MYTDWLDDHGWPARAAFLRAQCATAALPPRDPRRADFRAREEGLRQESQREWQGCLPIQEGHFEWLDFERGLPTGLRLDWNVFRSWGPQLFALASLRALVLRAGEGLSPDDAAELAASPLLGRLTALDLNGCHLGRSAWKPCWLRPPWPRSPTLTCATTTSTRKECDS